MVLPIIESGRGIVAILMKMRQQSERIKGLDRTNNTEQIAVVRSDSPYTDTNFAQAYHQKKILVIFDGSSQSLRVLYSAAYTYANSQDTKSVIYILHIIKWIDENDEELVAAMIEQGKRYSEVSCYQLEFLDSEIRRSS